MGVCPQNVRDMVFDGMQGIMGVLDALQLIFDALPWYSLFDEWYMK